ncbi:MAG TPA: BamA/TamA family outer membrane protein [Paludibacter sp.]|nr:BamA/TamA family outer membrane protein [Paludibacter sp.]
MKVRFGLLLIYSMLLITSCNVAKHVPEGEYLLEKVKITTDVNDISKDELLEYIRQAPNTKVFGLFRMQLGIYNLAGKDTTKWINRTLKKIGDEPVIYNPLQTAFSIKQLQLLYKNKGFIHAQIDTNIVFKGKKSTIEYIVKSNKPFLLGNYNVNLTDNTLFQIATDTSRTLIRPEMLFDTDVFNAERERIASRYRQLGHYNFNKDFLIYNADSSLNKNKVAVTLDLRTALKEKNNPANIKIFNKYKIRNIIYYNINDFNPATDFQNTSKPDTIIFNHFTLIEQKKQSINIDALIQNTFINPGAVYSDAAVERTYSALNSLGPVKYVNITFREVDEENLDCSIVIVPSKNVSLSTELEATYTDRFWGGAFNLGIIDRNVFGGAETLSLEGRGALEWQSNVLAQEWGAQVGLKFPSFLMPFINSETRRNLHANTEYNTSYVYQFRPGEFTTINLGGGIKYQWQRNRYRHSFDLADLSYVYFPPDKFSEEFRQNYLKTGLYNKYNYEDHFILRMGYSGSYSNFNANRPMRNYRTSRYSFESAGNLLYGINNLLGSQKEEGSYRLFNIRYAQYLRGEFNTTYTQIIDKNNRFVSHLGVGIGVPYGNADAIPYERRFYSGGANSVRGWSESTLGPGVYSTPDSLNTRTRDYNQVGDIKLDLNMEYRTKMFWVLEGALFLDAGNIWTIKEYFPEQKGGVFKLNTFMNQIAIAYGAGLRLDFSFFIFRLDLGARLFDPVRIRREQWRVKPDWSDFAFHLAIGYPF